LELPSTSLACKGTEINPRQREIQGDLGIYVIQKSVEIRDSDKNAGSNGRVDVSTSLQKSVKSTRQNVPAALIFVVR
jgi:hypothetical protein